MNLHRTTKTSQNYWAGSWSLDVRESRANVGLGMVAMHSEDGTNVKVPLRLGFLRFPWEPTALVAPVQCLGNVLAIGGWGDVASAGLMARNHWILGQHGPWFKCRRYQQQPWSKCCICTPSDSVSAWHLSVLSAWNLMVAKFGLWHSDGCPNSASWSGSGSTGPWMRAFLLWHASFALESAPDKRFLPFTQLFSCHVKALRPVNMQPHTQVWINTWSESDMLGVKAWDRKELAEPQSNAKYHHSTTKYCSIQGLELLQCQDTSQSNSFPPTNIKTC